MQGMVIEKWRKDRLTAALPSYFSSDMLIRPSHVPCNICVQHFCLCPCPVLREVRTYLICGGFYVVSVVLAGKLLRVSVWLCSYYLRK